MRPCIGVLSPQGQSPENWLKWLSPLVAAVLVAGFWTILLPIGKVHAATNPSVTAPGGGSAGMAPPLTDLLGVHFIAGSTSTVLLERQGRTYLIDLGAKTIREQDPPAAATAENSKSPAPSPPAKDLQSGAKIFTEKCSPCHGTEGKGNSGIGTPDFTSSKVQGSLTDEMIIKTIHEGRKGTAMPAWGGKLSDAEIQAVAAFVRSLGPAQKSPEPGSGAEANKQTTVYRPADDYLFSLPTGRSIDRHGFIVNFTHRFAFNPAFSGPGEGDTLLGLDGFSIPSFGLRYGITDKLSVSAYRSPSIIGRPIEFGLAYHFLDEHDGRPLNAAFRLSEDGQGDFTRNFTTNFEGDFSRSITRRAQIYFVPAVNLQNRELVAAQGILAAQPPPLPGFNTFSIGVGGALDIRPTVALVAEVIPTLVNGRELGIHRPAYSFGIQKRLYRHAFTIGFSNSPGTIVAQRAGTRATFVGDPSGDTPGGLFIGFDLMRQIY